MEVIHTKINQNKILYIFLGISLFIHLMFSITAVNPNFFQHNDLLNKNEKKFIVKLQSFKSNDKKQIVQTEQSLDNKAKNPRFLSNKNNSFEIETKSARIGSFRSAAKGERSAVSNRTEVVKKTTKKEKFKNIKFADLGFKASENLVVKQNTKRAQQTKTKKGLKTGIDKGIGLGRSNDYLEDMPLGDFTKLNTQEYEFYGFYHRVKQKLEQFWGANIHEQAERIFKQGRSLASDSNLVTGLVISLNSKGEIVDILVKSTSGIKELDDAAIRSFNQAGPFPNPPQGMIKQGRATIEWGFVVNT